MKPEFPLHVIFADGTEYVLETEEEIATSLEYFDTEDGDTSASVFDNQKRKVRLKVERLEVLICDLVS